MVGATVLNSRGRKPSLSRVEERREANNFTVVVGIDEAGRGPLCGPVVAAACIIPHCDGLVIDGITDSKKITAESEREQIYNDLTSDSRVMWFASVVSNQEIDAINILQASLTAMKRAAEGLINKYKLIDTSTYIALIDGNKIPEDMPVTSKCIIKGDGHIFSIAAASIIAKVTRDRIMIELDQKYPMYGLGRHKGYPTASHRSALYEHGPCEIYRMTYAPVKAATERQCALQKSGVKTDDKRCRNVETDSAVRKRGKLKGESKVTVKSTRDYKHTSNLKRMQVNEETSSAMLKVVSTQDSTTFNALTVVDGLEVEKLFLRRSSRLRSKV